MVGLKSLSVSDLFVKKNYDCVDCHIYLICEFYRTSGLLRWFCEELESMVDIGTLSICHRMQDQHVTVVSMN